jgi:hypothetical protein
LIKSQSPHCSKRLFWSHFLLKNDYDDLRQIHSITFDLHSSIINHLLIASTC